ncbi:hypothetical protein LCGC14_3084100, partial [marine sediment metagenome]
MLDWFKDQSVQWQIAIFAAAVPIAFAIVNGLLKLLFGLFRKKDPPALQQDIRQDGSGHTAANIDGGNNVVAGRDVNTGIDPKHLLDCYGTAQKKIGQSEETIKNQRDTIARLEKQITALNQLIQVSKEAGQSENEIKHLRETITLLEEQLAQPPALTSTGQEKLPQPTQEAKDIAAHIEDDAGPYALALKAIATGQSQEADDLLDGSQQLLDKIQEQKDQAQVKIYLARIQN